MSKRKYTHIKEKETQIIAMREAGMTRQEIADELGLEKVQIKAWITRYNHRKNRLQQGITPKPKGRPRKKPLSSSAEYERDFLEFAERM